MIVITSLFNVIFDTSHFPPKWSTSLICPIHKKGDVNNPENYRPISLLPTIYKIFASILNSRLKNWSESFLSQAQAGFRSGFSTTDNIFVLRNIISICLRKNKGKLYSAFIDFKAAFDSVDRKLLFEKLSLWGVNGKFLNIFKAMYTDVNFKVRLEGGVTKSINSTCGLRQGCPLSPLLFSIFINDIEPYLRSLCYKGVIVGEKEFFCLLYADDLVIMSESAYVCKSY